MLETKTMLRGYDFIYFQSKTNDHFRAKSTMVVIGQRNFFYSFIPYRELDLVGGATF